jgi:4-amino-4-deoxy-L-arabinose transferase-like glycosyltransferase
METEMVGINGRRGVGYGLILLVCGWALLYLPALGTRELQGEEARRILPGRTMLQTGDWVVPRSAGKIYNRKPPLINWTSALAIQATGKMEEWSVRLPSALAMLALAVTVLLAGRHWLGTPGAFFAACLCLTNVGFLGKGRLAEIEALYIAAFGIGLIVWLGAWWRDRVWLAWLGGLGGGAWLASTTAAACWVSARVSASASDDRDDDGRRRRRHGLSQYV